MAVQAGVYGGATGTIIRTGPPFGSGSTPPTEVDEATYIVRFDGFEKLDVVEQSSLELE